MSESKVQSKRGKVQIVLLVDQEIATALDTLRIIDATSRARVTEPLLAEAAPAALKPEIPTLGDEPTPAEVEAYSAATERVEGVRRVVALAERAGLTVAEYVAAYAKAYAKSTYGPGLDALEQDDREVTGKKAKPRPIAA